MNSSLVLIGVLFLISFTRAIATALPLERNSTGLHREDGGPTVKNCGRSIAFTADRIVNGQQASRGQFPWMVSLREKSSVRGFEHVCGAAILNERWIISAAHCFDFSIPSLYEVFVGLHKLSQGRDKTAKLHKVDKLILHPSFDDDTFENDIALVRTTQPIDIDGSGGYVNGVCLPVTRADPTGRATISGWGHEWLDGFNSDTLKYVDVPIVARDVCNNAYQEFFDDDDEVDAVTDSMICAGQPGKDSCQNDSGGPLVQYDKSGVATLVGIVSLGSGCGGKFFPGVYTKVDSFREWIEQNAV